MVAICVLYFVWAYIGRLITGQYAYKQLDPEYAGWRGLVAVVVTTLSLTTTIFLLTLGLHKLREYAAQKSDCQRRGH